MLGGLSSIFSLSFLAAPCSYGTTPFLKKIREAEEFLISIFLCKRSSIFIDRRFYQI
jgi:hypothetical protein